MKIIFCCSVFLIAISVQAKVPKSPLFKLQFWAQNSGGEISTDNPIGSGQVFQFNSKPGVDMNLVKAWDITTGSSNVVVAVIDDGFELNHENYKSNLGSGHNTVDPKKLPDACLTDIDRDGKKSFDCSFSHGNMALGIIGSKPSKEYGIAGINWNVTLMPLKKSDQQGVGADKSKDPSRTADAIEYAVKNGARVINWSGFYEKTTPQDEQKIRKAIDFAKKNGILVVVAAGNGLIDMDKDKKKLPFPMNTDFENVIYIANVNAEGTLVDYKKNPLGHRIGGSNFGLRAFMAAPAEFGITTKDVKDGKSRYFLGGGTSCAAPMVTGVAALLLSVNPKLDYKDIKQILCMTANKLDSLSNKTKCGGIPDAYEAVKMAKAGID